MTVGDLKRVLEEENISDDDDIVISSQDGSVWFDFFVQQESMNGESVALFELDGDGEGLLEGEDDEDYDFVGTGLGNAEDDEFDE